VNIFLEDKKWSKERKWSKEEKNEQKMHRRICG
jgi:hypothetical protein